MLHPSPHQVSQELSVSIPQGCNPLKEERVCTSLCGSDLAFRPQTHFAPRTHSHHQSSARQPQCQRPPVSKARLGSSLVGSPSLTVCRVDLWALVGAKASLLTPDNLCVEHCSPDFVPQASTVFSFKCKKKVHSSISQTVRLHLDHFLDPPLCV